MTEQTVELEGSGPLKGEITPPPDKSISHRAVMFAGLARGTSMVRNFLEAADTRSTVNAMRALGVEIEDTDGGLVVKGRGLHGLVEPGGVIDCGNSGTTIRLLAGILAGNAFFSVLTGDESLMKRPMGRVIKPLSLMGADIIARKENTLPPLAISGGGLRGISYETPVASAQLKSAVLLAGLYAGEETSVVEPLRSRDHTERMLPAFGIEVITGERSVKVVGGRDLEAADITVPGDFSSAAFFIAAALVVEGSEVHLIGVGLNPLRTGFLDVLRRMGAKVEVSSERVVSGEPVGDILCTHSALSGVEISGELVPSLVDEFPIICVLAALAQGKTVIRGAGELRVKESDRISAMAGGLRAMGVDVQEHNDGLSIEGAASLSGAGVRSMGDHRIAMAFSVAALAARGRTTIFGAEAVEVSFPAFFESLRGLAR